MKERRARQKRDADRRSEDRRRDTLGPALGGLKANEISQILDVRDARIEIRCPSTVKDEIEVVAGRFGLTVTTYLLRLHDLAKSKLDGGN